MIHPSRILYLSGLIVLCLQPVFALQAHTSEQVLTFANNEYQQRYNHMINTLRCLVCQNQNLADSDASLAKDLRTQVYKMIHLGKTNAEIEQFLLNRYGDFILYEPPMRKHTWLLWFGPFILTAISLLILFINIKKRRHQPAPDSQLNENEQQRLKELLGSDEDPS